MEQSKHSLLNDERAVFGMTSVKAFFVIILGIALLAYIIVVVMGTLANNTNIIPASSLTATVANESGFLNSSGDSLSQVGVLGFANPTIITMINGSSGQILTAGNYTLSSTGVYTNSSTNNQSYANVNITYSYNYNSVQRNNANSILTNVSSGVSDFFSDVNPVYAILAILVIILILVVLVRVVGGNINMRDGFGQQAGL